MMEIDAVGAIAILFEKRSLKPYSAASGQAPRSSASRRLAASACSRMWRNIFLFQTLATTLSNGTFCACRKEWKPITPRPTLRSRMALYFALAIESGAVSMNSCSTLSRKRITSGMKRGSSFHSNQVSRLSEERQHTAVRSRPCWSRAGRQGDLGAQVGGLHLQPRQLLVLGLRPVHVVGEDEVGLAGLDPRGEDADPQARAPRPCGRSRRPSGLVSGHSSSASTARMKASGTSRPWCRFSALRFGSPPVGRRISMNSSISGWLTGR